MSHPFANQCINLRLFAHYDGVKLVELVFLEDDFDFQFGEALCHGAFIPSRPGWALALVARQARVDPWTICPHV